MQPTLYMKAYPKSLYYFVKSLQKRQANYQTSLSVLQRKCKLDSEELTQLRKENNKLKMQVIVFARDERQQQVQIDDLRKKNKDLKIELLKTSLSLKNEIKALKKTIAVSWIHVFSLMNSRAQDIPGNQEIIPNLLPKIFCDLMRLVSRWIQRITQTYFNSCFTGYGR